MGLGGVWVFALVAIAVFSLFSLPSLAGNCIDSDNGINYYSYGFVDGPNGRLFDHCAESQYGYSNPLTEYYCNENGTVASVIYNCPNGCSGATCALPCNDTDGGIDIYNKGRTYSETVSYPSYNNSEDTCLQLPGGWFVKEYFCVPWAAVSTSIYKCPGDCVDGACVTVGSGRDWKKIEPLSTSKSNCNLECGKSGETCSETGCIVFSGTDNLTYSGGTKLTSYVGVGAKLYGHSCSGGWSNIRSDTHAVECCCSGSGQTNQTQTSCTDTDGGQNVYLKGITTGTNGSFSDTCFTGDNYSMVEYYCNGNQVNSFALGCSYGPCSDGACPRLNQTQNRTSGRNTCTDSDGGLNYYQNGTAAGPAYPNNETITLRDHCFNSTDLNEGGCGDGGYAGWYTYTCPYGCSKTKNVCMTKRNDGVEITMFSASTPHAVSGEPVKFLLVAENQGEKTAYNVKTEILGIGTKEWDLSGSKVISLSVLKPWDREIDVPGTKQEANWKAIAPFQPKGKEQEYTVGVKLSYDYKTGVIEPIRIENQTELNRLKQISGHLTSGPTSSTVGPMDVEIIIGNYDTAIENRMNYNNVFPVQIKIKNSGKGQVIHPAGTRLYEGEVESSSVDQTYPVWIKLTPPSGTSFRFVNDSGFDDCRNGIVVKEFYRGMETVLSCQLGIDVPPANAESRPLWVDVLYRYQTENKTKITIVGIDHEDEGGEGNDSEGGERDDEDAFINNSNPISPPNSLTCNTGCLSSGSCYQFGFRMNGTYCSPNGAFASQKNETQYCDNDFECASNICAAQSCVSMSLIEMILRWLASLFGMGMA